MVWGLPDNVPLFPHPATASDEGLLAYGNALTPQVLQLAYHFGIFPWYSDGDPILWWYTTPRCILYPGHIKIHKSMRAFMRKANLHISVNRDFGQVIRACAQSRKPGRESTWITDEMILAYLQLHKEGWGHSIEVWQEGKMIGGLYGLSLGRVFYGESMFSTASNASKVALIALCTMLQYYQFDLVDCQQATPHLLSMGAELMSHKRFSHHLSENRKYCLSKGKARGFVGTFEMDQKGRVLWKTDLCGDHLPS